MHLSVKDVTDNYNYYNYYTIDHIACGDPIKIKEHEIMW